MLLSYKFKLPGILLVLAGAVLTFFYFGFDFRFEMPVLAVFSSFMESRFFTTFRTNFADELIMLLFLSGLFMLSFSAEKHEPDSYKSLRIKALIKTVVADSIFVIFVLLYRIWHRIHSIRHNKFIPALYFIFDYFQYFKEKGPG